MNELAFVERRKADWEKLELILKKAGFGLQSLTRSELNDLGRIYRRTAGDLAFARSNSVNPKLIGYLNDLVGRGHGMLYEQPRQSARKAFADLIFTIPEAMRRNANYVWLAFIISILFAGLGYVTDAVNPTLGQTLIPAQFSTSLDHWKTGKSQGETASESATFTAYLYANNVSVAIRAFVFGISFGILTVFLLIYNGLTLGIFMAEVARVGALTNFLAGILPHGVSELWAIFISGGAGMLIGKAMLLPGDKSRFQSIKDASSDALLMMGGAAIMLILAAFLEGWFSHQNLPRWIKFGVALITFIMWSFYYAGFRRKK